MFKEYLNTGYLVNEEGVVVGVSGKILKPYQKNKYGHLIINIKGKWVAVHRMVAITFIPNPDNKPEVDHIDRNPMNNNVNNLRWVTHRENYKNINTRIAIRDAHKGNQNRCKPVNQYTLDGEYITTFNSVVNAGKTLGIDNHAIYQCVNGYNKTSGGYIWKYGE